MTIYLTRLTSGPIIARPLNQQLRMKGIDIFAFIFGWTINMMHKVGKIAQRNKFDGLLGPLDGLFREK